LLISVAFGYLYTGLATYPSSTSRPREKDTDRRVRHVDGGGFAKPPPFGGF